MRQLQVHQCLVLRALVLSALSYTLSASLRVSMHSVSAETQTTSTQVQPSRSQKLEAQKTNLAQELPPSTDPLLNLPQPAANPQPPLPLQSRVITVIRTNSSEWEAIATTLTGVKYVTVTLDALSETSLDKASVVLLPNAESLTAQQMQILKAWADRGGRLIITGAAGKNSEPEVQAQLRSLVGGYWDSKVETPANLVLRSSIEYDWARAVPEVSTTPLTNGGTLRITEGNSRTVAYWSANKAAILAKNNVIHLGWAWGTDKTHHAFDRNWLIVAAESNLQASNSQTTSRRSSEVAAIPATSDSQALRGTTQQSSFPDSILTKPIPISSIPKPSLPFTYPPNSQPKYPASLSPTQANPSQTPAIASTTTTTTTATQTTSLRKIPLLLPPRTPATYIPAPTPALPPISDQPIFTLEALTMHQELQELIGRVENAMTTANTAQGRSLGTASNQLTTINIAKQLLKDLPQLIADRQFVQARTLWQLSRQNLWKDYPSDLLVALPEVRAMWLDRGTIVAAGSEERLARVFDRMAASGVNTVFLETVNAGYPIYPSRVAPQSNPLTRGWDPLASAVRLAHQRNMELHAWVWVFGVGNTRHNTLIGKPANYVGPVLEAYPQWANIEQNGSIFAPEGKTFLDPANPEVQDYLLRLYREIVTQYKVDGLQLDYIRYPRQDLGSADFGFSTVARSRFMQLTGVDPVNLSPNNRSLWWAWTEFRAQQVNQFVGRVSKEMRAIKPNLMLSAAVFPWKFNERLSRMQQNWENWVSKGEIDMLMPMTYVGETSRFIRQEVKPTLTAVGQSPVLFLPGMLIRDLPDIELLDQLQAIRDLPASGYSLFAAEHLRPSFENILRHARTNQDAQILPHRRPFAAAQARYTALKQEWQALLKYNLLWVKGENLAIWQQEVESLDRVLQTLNLQPTPANLKIATLSLDRMSTNLPKWMKLENLEQPYRVTTWVNRLEAIAAIVRYGEAKMAAGRGDTIGGSLIVNMAENIRKD
ncbi:family 10 glycosylhydrolase [Tumidithrix helvetica PCC 7403]